MSVHQLPLPSPPPDVPAIGPMSGLFCRSLSNQIDSDDPVDTSTSDLDAVTRKKVGFHPWTTNILEHHLSTPDSEATPSLKSIPPSRDCQLNTRPILKPTQSSEFFLGLDGQNDRTSPFEKMDSLLQNLSRNDRSSSVDAYQTMTSLIRMYDEPPEQEVLQTKMTQLQAYIKRDLVILDKSAEALPSEERLSMGNLVMSALKVLVTMVWSPVYSPCLSDSFRQWTVDRSIQVLMEHTAPKAVLLHYMHLLATQSFSIRLMASNNRAPKIVEVLQELTDHVSGKAVVAERLLVYQKLIDQAKPVMEKKIDLWIKNLLSAMAHSFKEIRSNAISAGTKACTAFAANPATVTAARQALAEMTGERSLSASMTNRLERVLAAKDEANQIPQIWTIVLMLCNGKSNKLDSWPQLHEWLKLIQKCFNCSDSTVRVQAFMAWNRLYFVAKPSEASEKVVSMLAKPAMNQLDKTGNNVSGKGTRQAVISSYCMLLYYAFRPSSTSQQYTRMWNEFVVKLMTRSFLAKSSANCDLCCRVLAALFHSSLPMSRVWNENRAHENAPLDPLELPAIDSKWTRVHISSILSIIRLLVEYSSFGPSGIVSEQSYIAQTWRHLMKAIRESSSKEVVASADSKHALQSLLDFFGAHSTNQDACSDEPVDSLRTGLLARITITELSPPVILQALEHSTSLRIGTIFQELLFGLISSIEEAEAEHSDQRSTFVRCFEIMREDLGRLVDPSSTVSNSLRDIVLDSTSLCLQAVPTSEIVNCLICLQDHLVTFVKQTNHQRHDNRLDQDNQSAYQKLCFSVVNHLCTVEVSEYHKLDALLSACITTENLEFRRHILSAKDGKFWVVNYDAFGPELSSAVAPYSSLDLEPQSEQEQEQESRITSSRPKSSFATKMARQLPQVRPRHDDSQVNFVTVHSSPPDYESLESQFLTAHQKEVRHRQHTERVLTFADIRSSPSMKKGRKETEETASVLAESLERQSTPVLPQQRAQDDEAQPPTPTPRTRNSFRAQIQPEMPDIPSSPPSVAGKGRQNAKAATITSSPVKDTNEAEGFVRLDITEKDTVTNDKCPKQTTAHADNDPNMLVVTRQNERHESPEVSMADYHSTALQSGYEEYGTAETEPASPDFFSDEYDALAASQLSQSLVEESNSVTNSIEHRVKAMSKRKRSEDTGVNGKKSKRRKGSETQNIQIPSIGNREENDEEEIGECIVVNTEVSNSRQASRSRPTSRQTEGGIRTGPPSPALSQASQKSVASAPQSQYSAGKRKRRLGRKSRSRNSQESSPITEVPVTKPTEAIETTIGGFDVTVEQDRYLSEAPSLASEVKETNQEGSIPSSHKQQFKMTNADLTSINTNHPVSIRGNGAALGAGLGAGIQINASMSTEAISSSTQELQVSTDFDVVRGLQSILDTLDLKSSGDGNNLDLATVHRLCFQIGLKAQQLAQR